MRRRLLVGVAACALAVTPALAQSTPDAVPGIGSAYPNRNMQGDTKWSPTVDQWDALTAYKLDNKPGSAAGNLGFTPSFVVNIADYCTSAQIAADIYGCGQNAIDEAVSLASGGNYGGAIVRFPAKFSSYKLAGGKLLISSSFVTLQGDGKQASYIECANGAADCVQIGQATGSQVRDDRIVDLGIWGDGNKTAGAGVHIENAYNIVIDTVDLENMVRGVDNDATASDTNSVTLRDVDITINQASSDYGIDWHADGTGAYRSDLLNIYNTTISGGAYQAPNGECFHWDGLANTATVHGLKCLKLNYGLRVVNTAASATNVPGFLNADALEFEGFKSRAVSIEAGYEFKISNSDLNNSYGVVGQGSADDYAVAVLADAAASNTRGVQIVNSRIGISAKSGLYNAGRNTQLANDQFVSTSASLSGGYPVIENASTAVDFQARSIVCEEYGGLGRASYCAQLDAGATGGNIAGLDARYVKTGAVSDLGATGFSYSGLTEPAGFSGTQMNLHAGSTTGIFLDEMWAQSTGAGVASQRTLLTGTTGSAYSDILHDNNGAPYHQTVTGSAVTADYHDAPIHIFRSVSGVEEARIDGTGVKLPNGYGFTVNGAAGFSGSKTAGSCTFTISGGIITAVAGC